MGQKIPEHKCLWTIACKLRAIGELIKHRGCEPPLDEDEINFGIGEILTDLADELGGGSNVGE